MKNDDSEESLRDTLVAAFRESPDTGSTTQGAEPGGGSKDTPRSVDTSSEKIPNGGEDAKRVGADKGSENPSPPTSGARDEKAKPAEGGQQKPLEPPARWTKAEKEEFAALDPNIQRVLLARNKGLEQDYTRKMGEVAQERQRYSAIEKILASRREGWQRSGMDDASALNFLMSQWDLAERDPMAFVNTFAQARGIDLASMYAPTAEQLAHYFGQAQGQSGPDSPSPAVHPLVMQQLEFLSQRQQQLDAALGGQQQHLAAQQQEQERALRQAAASEIQQFASAVDGNGQPLYPFLEDVRGDMARLMQHGFASTLKDAYEQAARIRPDVYAKIEESREIARRREEGQRRQEEAARAKRAGSSISPSPSSSPSPALSGQDDGDEDGLSLRQVIERQFDRARIGSRVP